MEIGISLLFFLFLLFRLKIFIIQIHQGCSTNEEFGRDQPKLSYPTANFPWIFPSQSLMTHTLFDPQQFFFHKNNFLLLPQYASNHIISRTPTPRPNCNSFTIASILSIPT